MKDNYPTDDELDKVAKWPWQDVQGWFTFIQGIWMYANADGSNSPYWSRRGRFYRVSTGGWSGNESVVSAMMQNLVLWSLTWHKSWCGGHFVFEDPTWKQGTVLGGAVKPVPRSEETREA